MVKSAARLRRPTILTESSKSHSAKAELAHVEKLMRLHDLLYGVKPAFAVDQSCRGWMRLARTERSDTSCPESTRRVARVTSFKQPSTLELDHDFLAHSFRRTG